MRASAVSSMRQEPPALRRASVLRPRLLERLRERFAARVTVVVAPAGFGKTTLLAQAVAENRLSPRGAEFWLTCIADDVAGSSLAEGLCHGLGVTPPGGLDAAVDKIVETTWHHSPAEVALVIDDVHEIAAHSPGADVLTRLAAALPRNGHLVLSGRQPPAVPLSRLEVQGQVLHLHQHDLLFTDDELAEFYAQRHVAADDLADLARCGGWPALAELVATAGPRVEADYLWEEVLAGIVPERRRDLALLAHVGPFDDALASAVLDRATDAAELTADLPLVTSGASGRRQIHGLWRPHLARLIDEADIAEARRRAGLELARAGDVVTAVRLLGQADAWDDLTEVVADVLGAAHTPVAGDVVAGWLGRLPDRLAGGPLARLLGAVAAVQTDPRAATRDLADAADAFRAEGNVTGELACMAQAGQLAWWFEEPEQLFRLALRLFEIEALGHRRAAPLACLGRALIADTQADSEGVLADLGRIPAGSLPDNLQGLVDWLRATSLNHLGRPTEGLEAADAALAQVHQFLAPVIELTQLQSRWYLGHIDEVLERLPSVLERTATTGLRDYTALVAAACCQAFATAGRTADAVRCLELVRASVAPGPAGPGSAGDLGEPGEPTAPAELPPLVAANLVVSEALTAVAAGDETTAAQVLAEHQARSGPVGAGLAAFPQHRSLTLWYLLAPDTRPVWDEAALGPCYAVARDLARALVAVRTDGRIGASPPLPAPGLVRAVLPLPWTAQLALAHVAAGRADGWALLEAVWPEAQAEVRRQADSGSGPLVRPARAALARLPVPPTGRLELRLLGPVELCRDGVPVEAAEWRRQRVRSLLADLVLHRPVSRERLGADLWPRLDADAQSRNLRVTLTHLLRVLEPERGERDASFLIRSHGFGLLLQGGKWFTSDLWRFDELWRRASEADAEGLPSAALDAMQEAVALWRDDPSELALDEWALPHVEERRLRLVNMAARAAELLLARDEPDAARQMAEAALRCDPWCERAHRVTVAAHQAAGHHRAARAAVHRYHEVLTELGLDATDAAHVLAPLTRTLGPTP